VGPERYNAGPIRTRAELAGLAGDTILKLSRAGLETNALIILPTAALIIRANHANARKTLTMPDASLGFGIARQVYSQSGKICPLNIL
jgi:hypothetical protein